MINRQINHLTNQPINYLLHAVRSTLFLDTQYGICNNQYEIHKTQSALRNTQYGICYALNAACPPQSLRRGVRSTLLFRNSFWRITNSPINQSLFNQLTNNQYEIHKTQYEIMQNKANFKNVQTDISAYMTKDYAIFRPSSRRKNKANQSQFKPNSNPILT